MTPRWGSTRVATLTPGLRPGLTLWRPFGPQLPILFVCGLRLAIPALPGGADKASGPARPGYVACPITLRGLTYWRLS